MHHIQRKILDTLLYASSLGYAAMRPAGIESNHYAYHLEQLLKEGLIAKQDKRYTLSPKGLAFVDRLSHQDMTERLQPHIVTVVDITNNRGQTLAFKRSFQPYIHRWGFALGKTHYQESVQAAAERELYEKTGLQNIPLTQRGIVYVESRQAGTTISKILCHVFSGEVTSAPQAAPTAPHRGTCQWLDHTTLTPANSMPGFHAIKQLLSAQQDTLFFAEFCEEI